MEHLLNVTTVVIAVSMVIAIGIVALLIKSYHKVEQGQALIRNGMGGLKVTFTGTLVLPIVHKAEYMNISLKTVEIDRRGKEGLICKDDIRADIKVAFFVRVNETLEDVLLVAKSVGCARASEISTIEELFGAKFSEALKTVGKQLNFEDLYQERDRFRDEIKRSIGQDLNGYVLEDAAIDFLEQTPIQELDPDNVFDSEGIRKITELTATKRVRTTEISNRAKKDIGKDNLETTVAMLEYERQEADARARQAREVQVVRAREKAEAEEITAQQLARENVARVKAEQVVNIENINKTREEQVAEKNRERVIAIETETVEKERQLQIIARERETELQRISKDKELEVEKKNIADVVRERVAVEKTVAEEEELIKDLRVLMEADRNKKATVIEAEAEAEKALVVDIKAAEASEEVSKHKARERLITADAELDASERIAKAKIRIAEGQQAEEAASGLAKVKVKEADAAASEKQGMVEARVLKEKLLAEAAGNEETGMVEIRLTESRAAAIEKEGMAEAAILREKMVAEAAGSQEKGMVDVRLKEAFAEAIAKEGEAEARVIAQKGEAEAVTVREKLAAEASGIAEKAEAMRKLDAVSIDHEEFRLALEQERELTMERIRSGIDIAKSQAEVLAEAFKAAKINIVGGDDQFYNNFIQSVSVGKMVEGFMDQSPSAQRVFDRILKGKNNREANGSVNLAEVVGTMIAGATSESEKERLNEVMEKVQELDQSGVNADGE